MISLSSGFADKSVRMDDLLMGLDSQLRLYFWTINEMNAIQCMNQIHNCNLNRNQIRVSHYKKRWRDRYIQPPSHSFNSEDPLKMMDKMVNNDHTYDHVIEFKNILNHIVEDQNPVFVENIIK